MNALEEKMDHFEELIEGLDTSKMIININRPPLGAPASVSVDLLVVGDTWLEQGDNIVYKLVQAEYNYQPVPSVEPYHKFTWQPLNERYANGNTDPPTSVVYQAVSYTINDTTWSWVPVPEYFIGDHYKQYINVGDYQYFVCNGHSISNDGTCSYTWREEGKDSYTKAETNALLNAKENTSNKVTSLSAQSTNTQYPSAKCVYDFVTDQIGNIETALSEV
jgi:hypothetical protein